MEAEDDDRSFNPDGDPLFAIDRNEDDLPSLLEHSHLNYEAKHKRAAASGGALLSVPLVAVDVTVSLQRVQEGECKEDADAVATPEVEKVAAKKAKVPNRFPWAGMFRRGHAVDDTRNQEIETDDSSEFDKEESGEIDSPQLMTTPREAGEEKVEESKPKSVGLRAGGLMWLMSQRKAQEEETEPREVLEEVEETPAQDAGGLAWLVSQAKALEEETEPREFLEERDEKLEDDPIATQKDEEKEPQRGPLGWLAQRRKNHAQNEATHLEMRKIEHMQGLKEAASAKHTWMSRFQRIERDDTDSCDDDDDSYYSDGSSSYGSDSDSDSEYDSDDDSEYSSDESDSDEEEVVFACDDSVHFTGALFSDGIVEQAYPTV